MSINQEESSFVTASTSDWILGLDRKNLGFITDSSSMGFRNGRYGDGCCTSVVDVYPPVGLFSDLDFLGLRDLFTVQRVSKSQWDEVQSNPKSLCIDYPLNRKITDDDLLFLAGRAKGSLQSLNLVGCVNITDGGLKRVIESNPGLTKLNVAGCSRLTIEGILSNLKLTKSLGNKTGIKYLRIGGIFGVTREDFEELKFLLGLHEKNEQQQKQKPRFFRPGPRYLFNYDDDDDQREIDVEVCPKCQQVREVYDCNADGCKGCRSCAVCTSLCANCGRCLSNCDYEETFYLDLVCLDCWNQSFKSPGGKGTDYRRE